MSGVSAYLTCLMLMMVEKKKVEVYCIVGYKIMFCQYQRGREKGLMVVCRIMGGCKLAC